MVLAAAAVVVVQDRSFASHAFRLPSYSNCKVPINPVCIPSVRVCVIVKVFVNCIFGK